MAALRRLPPGRAALPLVGASALLLLSGCIGLFEPATPQAPSDGVGSIITLDYSDPEAALATLAEGINAKGLGNGQAAYIGAFADSATDGVPYYAVFDPEDLAGQTAPVWGRDLELNFYGYFVSVSGQPYIMNWSDIDADVGPDEQTLYAKYEVFTVVDGIATTRIAVGFADLVFRKINNNRWAIVRWRDRVDPSVDPNDTNQRTFGARRLETQ